MQGFGTLECGKNKTLPTQAHHHSPAAGGREFRATVPQTLAFRTALSDLGWLIPLQAKNKI